MVTTRSAALTMTSDVKATVFVFPHEELTRIDGKPTHESVELLIQEVYSNACQNECSLGGGQFGYLGIVMPDATYAEKQMIRQDPIIPFTKPTLPTEVPLTREDKLEFKEIQQQLVNYNAMEGHLKKQIIQAIDRTYIAALADRQMGFTMITAKALLAYIVKEYDTIDYADIIDNRNKLDSEWDITQPITMLWNRIDDIKAFALAGGSPIDDRTIMQATLTVLANTGVFDTHIIIWKQKPQADWRYNEFMEFFNNAERDRNTKTAKTAGFHTANATKPMNTPPTNNNSNTTVVNNGQWYIKTDATGYSFDARVMRFGNKDIWFCHSHGGSTNPNHTSETCNRPKEGHVRQSTWDNICGGCTDMNWSNQNKAFKKKGKCNNNNSTNSANNATNTDDNNSN